MMFGAPQPTEIPFDVAVDPYNDDAAKVPANNHPALEAQPPWRRYSILYATLAHNLGFVPISNGKYRSSVEYVCVLFDADGQRVNYVSSVARDLNADEYNSLLVRGMLFRQEIVVPAKGEYYLRIGLLDDSNDRAGVVEIPLSSIHSRAVAATAK
jgi:hypothetical protein